MTVVPGYCSDTTTDSDNQINLVIQRYMEYQVQQDYNGVWKLLSQRIKNSVGNNRFEYEKYVRSHGFHPHKVEIQKTVVSEAVATVTVNVTYIHDKDRRTLGTALEEWTFVRENGSWLFNDYKTLIELSD